MLTAEQITAIGAVLSSVVVGLVALVGFQHESRERQRHQDFQRDMVIALQESAWELQRVVVDMMTVARDHYVAIEIRHRLNIPARDRTFLDSLRAGDGPISDEWRRRHGDWRPKMTPDEADAWKASLGRS